MTRFNGFQYEIDGSRSFNSRTRVFGPMNPLPAANAFEQRIFGFLNTINTDLEVGKAILIGVGLGRKIGIVPGDSLFSRVVNLGAMGNGQVVHGTKLTGTGRGADGQVVFDLAALAAVSGPAAQKEAILLHEIVHAIRNTWGLRSEDAMPIYENVEEFYAVTLTNMYISSAYPGATLRGDHGLQPVHVGRLSGAPNGAISNPGLGELSLRRFVMSNKTELLRFIDEMEALALTLSRAKCKFNPFRVCYKGWDPAVEEKDVAKERRQPGFGPLTRETFADAADRVLAASAGRPSIF